MNDRYLCRAKRTDNGEWVEGYIIPRKYEGTDKIFEAHIVVDAYEQIGVFNMGRALVSEVGYECFVVDPSTICQCTGLKDKNGKLIWENDIVDGHIKRGAAFYRCKVLWNECKARFDVRAMECNFPMTLDECADDISICGLDYEVVGNIFDNPELLEVGE